MTCHNEVQARRYFGGKTGSAAEQKLSDTTHNGKTSVTTESRRGGDSISSAIIWQAQHFMVGRGGSVTIDGKHGGTRQARGELYF